jgi:hypothetical protein
MHELIKASDIELLRPFGYHREIQALIAGAEK